MPNCTVFADTLEASPTPKRLAFSVGEAAALCGIGPSTMWALLRLGQVKATRIGRRTLILNAELERFLAEATKRSSNSLEVHNVQS